jgi:hypothetical protein
MTAAVTLPLGRVQSVKTAEKGKELADDTSLRQNVTIVAIYFILHGKLRPPR